MAVPLILLLLFALVAGLPAQLTSAQQDEAPPPPPTDESPFQRRDTPPEEVLTQLNFGGAVRGDAGPDCVFSPAQAPSATPACVLEVAEDAALTFHAFSPFEVIVVEVTRPDEVVDRAEVTANQDGTGQLARTTLPGEPLGAYVVFATQGALQATGSFTVRAATEPQSVVLPRAAPPGMTFQVALAGFPPGASVPLFLYRDIGETFWYLADLPAARMDERGEALYALATQVGDPEDRYLVLTEPRVAGSGQLGGQFLLTRGDDPTVRDPNELIAALALAAVGEANRVWAAVLTDPGRPIADLERVYAGARLSQASAEVAGLRTSGQYRAAQLAAPLTVRSAQELSRFRVDVVVFEVWQDRLHNADGSVARDLSGPVERRYALELRFEPCYCWFVVEQT